MLEFVICRSLRKIRSTLSAALWRSSFSGMTSSLLVVWSVIAEGTSALAVPSITQDGEENDEGTGVRMAHGERPSYRRYLAVGMAERNRLMGRYSRRKQRRQNIIGACLVIGMVVAIGVLIWLTGGT